ncbi:UNVERIFIED_CONTAM: hypothetical protein K2H54_031510 [Gekko kuhli]
MMDWHTQAASQGLRLEQGPRGSIRTGVSGGAYDFNQLFLSQDWQRIQDSHGGHQGPDRELMGLLNLDEAVVYGHPALYEGQLGQGVAILQCLEKEADMECHLCSLLAVVAGMPCGGWPKGQGTSRGSQSSFLRGQLLNVLGALLD